MGEGKWYLVRYGVGGHNYVIFQMVGTINALCNPETLIFLRSESLLMPSVVSQRLLGAGPESRLS